MNSICSPHDSWSCKTRRRSYFYQIFRQRSLVDIFTKNFNLEYELIAKERDNFSKILIGKAFY